jgi:hypothetical protein
LLNVLATTFILKNIMGGDILTPKNISPQKYSRGGNVFLVNNHSHPKNTLKIKKWWGGGRVGMGKKVFLDLKGYFVRL